MGGNGRNPNDASSNSDFVTAVLKKNRQTAFALKGGNSPSGGLTTFWNGSLPKGYAPMHQEGAIVLGTGGGGDDNGIGSFFEGVMKTGFPSNAADAAVQASIVAAGYSGASGGRAAPAGTIAGPGGQCIDVAGPGAGINSAVVALWNCESGAIDQRWTHNSDNSLSTLGRCSTSPAAAPRLAPRLSCGAAVAARTSNGCSWPTDRCSTPCPDCASTTRAATPPTAPS